MGLIRRTVDTHFVHSADGGQGCLNPSCEARQHEGTHWDWEADGWRPRTDWSDDFEPNPPGNVSYD